MSVKMSKGYYEKFKEEFKIRTVIGKISGIY